MLLCLRKSNTPTQRYMSWGSCYIGSVPLRVGGMPTPTTPTSTSAGPAFRAARVGAGLGVRALAGYVKKSHATISLWERGQREISPATYQLLTDALADYLAGTWAP